MRNILRVSFLWCTMNNSQLDNMRLYRMVNNFIVEDTTTGISSLRLIEDLRERGRQMENENTMVPETGIIDHTGPGVVPDGDPTG